MNLDQWLADGTIKRIVPRQSQVDDLLTSADKDIAAAVKLLELQYFGISRDTSYEAMLKAGMALMFSRGFRPEAGSHHVTVVRFTESVLGNDYQELIITFDRLRRLRHQRLYQGKEIATRSQSESAVFAAERLISAVKEFKSID